MTHDSSSSHAIKDRAELERLVHTQGSGVLLNHPGAQNTLTPGQALRWALEGRTHSFTAIVGYFHHHPALDAGKSRQHPELNDDPARIIIEEAHEEGDYFLSQDEEETTFQLLAGLLCSIPATLAARLWYWTCRWKHRDGGREQALRVRRTFLQRASTLQSQHHENAFALACLELLDLDSTIYQGSTSGPLQDHQWLTELALHPDETPEKIEAYWSDLLYTLGLRDEPVTATALPPLDEKKRKAAAILHGFLLQRMGSFKLAPGRHEINNSTTHTVATVATFHPKIYIVERGERDPSTITFVGSNNWSDKAMGSQWTDRDRKLGNVEVSTVHAVSGHVFSGHDTSTTTHMARDVSATGRYIYHSVGEYIGEWCQDRCTLDVVRLHDRFAVYTKPAPHEYVRTLPDTLDHSPEPPTIPFAEQLTPYLLDLIERVLGIKNSGRFADLQRLTLAEHATLYGGRTPSQYQFDGTLRLLSMLSSERLSHRGAFLTDEAGLGKTLTAKMTATQLIVWRLIERAHQQMTHVPLLCSLIAPARLVGSNTSDYKSGWHAHANEIREAVHALLNEYNDLQKRFNEFEPEHPRPLLDIKNLMGNLQLRVISAGAFSRELVLDPPSKLKHIDLQELTLKPSSTSSDPVGDLLHVACSEVVVIDESHNFRNQHSYGVRALRFALSLPCPGEQWPMLLGEDMHDTTPRPARRRVLCLSATPFNNRLEDLTTQIGHFAHVQDWSKVLGLQRSLPGDPLQDALMAWRELSLTSLCHDTDSKPLPLRRQLFETLLVHTYQHLRSGRSLYIDPHTEKDRTNTGQERGRVLISDRGPDYVWPEEYEELSQQLADVYRWLHRRKELRESQSSPDITLQGEDKTHELRARTNLDAMLCGLMVQRSRARALQLTAASSPQGEALIRRMFRKPRVPRYPLAINDSLQEKDSVEGKLLQSVYTMLSRDEESEDELLPDTLTLHAYNLGVLRARIPYGHKIEEGASFRQTIQNNLGFQKVNLVKRLQSSPYAFMRTAIRGPLRRTLYELALLERLTVSMEERGLLSSHPLHATLAQISERLEQLRSGLFAYRHDLRSIAEICDGAMVDTSYYFCGLGGFFVKTGHPEARQFSDRPVMDRFERDYQALEEAMSLQAPEHFDESAFKACWAHDLFQDVNHDRSRLGHDLNVSIQWTLNPDSAALVRQLYKHLEDVFYQDKPLFARPFNVLTRAFLHYDQHTSTPGLKATLRWLEHRLRTDQRITSLIAWLLVQHGAVHHLPTLRPDASLQELVPAGRRSLIFSEYTDTQRYMTTIFTALVVVYRNPNALSTSALSRLLLDAMHAVGVRLDTRSQVVRGVSTSQDARSPHTNYQSPLDITLHEELLADLNTREDGLEQIILSLGQRIAHISSSTSSYLLEPVSQDTGTQEDSGEMDELDEIESMESTAQGLSGDVVDAFSPWYQIAPQVVQDSAQRYMIKSKLNQARQHPVDVLCTTEVLSEGVNLQECGVVIHYDLPWNPTRLIQRNGRVDRRLFELYEDDTARHNLIHALNTPSQETEHSERPFLHCDPPAFEPPAQVYHMTLLPVEPEGVDLTRRVRERLFEKLDTIRGLFGLSYWPVVLDEASAREVLTGELDFETPGFRRREELFQYWNALTHAHPPEKKQHMDSTTRSVTLRLSKTFREQLATHLLSEGAKTMESPLWPELTRAGISAAAPSLEQVKAVRSAPEYHALHNSPILSGTLMFKDSRKLPHTAPPCRQLIWNHVQTQKDLVPVLMSSILHAKKPGELAPTYNLSPIKDIVLESGSPTTLAEDILVALLDCMLNTPEMILSMHTSTSPDEQMLPDTDAGPHARTAHCWLWHLTHPYNQGAVPDEGKSARYSLLGLPDTYEDTDSWSGFNLWIDLT